MYEVKLIQFAKDSVWRKNRKKKKKNSYNAVHMVHTPYTFFISKYYNKYNSLAELSVVKNESILMAKGTKVSFSQGPAPNTIPWMCPAKCVCSNSCCKNPSKHFLLIFVFLKYKHFKKILIKNSNYMVTKVVRKVMN